MGEPELKEKKRLIVDFLVKCNAYADRMLEGYRSELATANGPRALELQDRISHWTAYRVFNEHAIGELDEGRLDEWFDEAP